VRATRHAVASAAVVEQRDTCLGPRRIRRQPWSSVCGTDVSHDFAGNDVDVAKYYPEDRDSLLEYEPNVVHSEVVGSAPEGRALSSSALRSAE